MAINLQMYNNIVCIYDIADKNILNHALDYVYYAG